MLEEILKPLKILNYGVKLVKIKIVQFVKERVSRTIIRGTFLYT